MSDSFAPQYTVKFVILHTSKVTLVTNCLWAVCSEIFFKELANDRHGCYWQSEIVSRPI
jgi:hypothetical protein